MKRSILTAFTFSMCCALATPALADFMGPYDVANWDSFPDGGIIDLSGAPTSITMVSNDLPGDFPLDPSFTEFSI